MNETYNKKLGMHETDMRKVVKWREKGKPHRAIGGKYWLTKNGKLPVIVPDDWMEATNDTIKVARLPRFIKAIEMTTYNVRRIF